MKILLFLPFLSLALAGCTITDVPPVTYTDSKGNSYHIGPDGIKVYQKPAK